MARTDDGPAAGYPAPEELVKGIQAGDRAALARAITLVESRSDRHREIVQELLQRVAPLAGGAHRVGITGMPGVGKSTLIDAFGMHLVERGHRVAVLAVDPSSARTGGSILGDKTRMARLSQSEGAFVRPSPSGGSLGGVSPRTREALLLCEAAGYDVVIVETVGIGQAEAHVAKMVDFLLVLTLAGAGDDLQGMKRGILEEADMLAITKADDDNRRQAQVRRGELEAALRMIRRKDALWTPPVLLCSAKTGEGINDLWERISAHRDQLTAAGHLQQRRQRQLIDWMWSLVEEDLIDGLHADAEVRQLADRLSADVVERGLSPAAAAAELVALYGRRRRSSTERS
jgi:LAO/AO transport system kinase